MWLVWSELDLGAVAQHVDRRVAEIAGSKSRDEQLLLLVEVVMWIKAFEENFDGPIPCPEMFMGLTHARHKGLHKAVELSQLPDVYSDRYTAMYGVPVWIELPPARTNDRGIPIQKHVDEEQAYREHFLGRTVFGSLEPVVERMKRATGRDR